MMLHILNNPRKKENLISPADDGNGKYMYINKQIEMKLDGKQSWM